MWSLFSWDLSSLALVFVCLPFLCIYFFLFLLSNIIKKGVLRCLYCFFCLFYSIIFLHLTSFRDDFSHSVLRNNNNTPHQKTDIMSCNSWVAHQWLICKSARDSNPSLSSVLDRKITVWLNWSYFLSHFLDFFTVAVVIFLYVICTSNKETGIKSGVSEVNL